MNFAEARRLSRILAVCAVLHASPWSLMPAAAEQSIGCPAGLAPRTVAELIFGRNIGEVIGVGEAEWQSFLDAEVTPRFPSGLTVVDAAGQWREPASGRIVREPSKLLLVVLGEQPTAHASLAEIIAAYKQRFSQQSVLLLLRQACFAE